MRGNLAKQLDAAHINQTSAPLCVVTFLLLPLRPCPHLHTSAESLNNFSSFRANACVFAGKWMYEATIQTAWQPGIQQVRQSWDGATGFGMLGQG